MKDQMLAALAAYAAKKDTSKEHDSDESVLGAMSPDNDDKITGWNERNIKLKPSNRPPLLQEKHTEGKGTKKKEPDKEKHADTSFLDPENDTSLDHFDESRNVG